MDVKTGKIVGNNFEIRLSEPSVSSGFIKVFFQGRLAAAGADHRLILSINEGGNYQGFAVMDGHASTGEWESSGIYLGRNGWGLDAEFSTEVNVSVTPGGNKITTSALSTFVNSDGRILGYHSNGYLISSDPVRVIRCGFPGNPVISDALTKFVVI